MFGTTYIFILLAITSATSGLKCYICEGRTRDGRALGSFTSDICSDPSKIVRNRTILRPCNNFEDVNNKDDIQGMNLADFAYTCVKNVEYKAHNEEIVIRRCMAVLKSEMITGCETVKVNDNGVQNDVQICYCNGGDDPYQTGCNSANGNYVSTFTLVIFGVVAKLLIRN